MLALLASIASAATAAAAGTSELLGIDAAPPRVHFVARFRSGTVTGTGTGANAGAATAWHRLEVWRDGEHQLHRRTDDALDLFAHEGADGELHLRLIDRVRRLAADVSRTNLYRIGLQTDAFGLAHVIQSPVAGDRIEPAAAPTVAPLAGDCRWLAIVREQARPRRSLACWSAAWGLPLSIVDADRGEVEIFRIDRVDPQANPQAGWPAVPAGFAHVDVDDETGSD